MNKQIKQINFFNEEGCIAKPGWSTDLVWKFDPNRMAANYNDFKAWDYYLVMNRDYGVSFSIAFTGSFSRLTATFLDFKNKIQRRNNAILHDDIHQPNNDRGAVYFNNSETEGWYIRKPGKHYIKIDFKNFDGGDDYICNFTLDVPEADKMVIATPFQEDKKCFFYNMKLNCMKATGTLIFGNKTYEFTPDKDFAVLDFGRGVWPLNNRWYWGSGSGIVDGIDFGFNIGYGFGDLSAATENMIFYGGKAHKFNNIQFNIPSDSYMKPWTIVSDDDRFVMDFHPVLDRDADVNLPKGKSIQHQVFGNYTGKAVLDDGKVINVKNFFGFAEDVINDWS